MVRSYKHLFVAGAVLLVGACGSSGTRIATGSSTSAAPLTLQGSVPPTATDLYAVEATPRGTQPRSLRAEVGSDGRFSLSLARNTSYVLTASNKGRVLGSVRFATTRTGSATTSLLHIPSDKATQAQALEAALDLGQLSDDGQGVIEAEKNPLSILDSDHDGQEDLDDADDDGDGKADTEDDDSDGDGNTDEESDFDSDHDDLIDAVDTDDDNDGVSDTQDPEHQGDDSDHDGVANADDTDDDNDGIPDSEDSDDNDDGMDDSEE